MAGESIPGVALPFNVPVPRWSYDLQFAPGSFDQFLEEAREYGRDVVFTADHYMGKAADVIAREGNDTLIFEADDEALRFLASLPESMEKWTTAQKDAWLAYEQRLMLSVSVGAVIFDYEVKNADEDEGMERELLTVTRGGMVELSRVPRPAFTEAIMTFGEEIAGVTKTTTCRVVLLERREGELVEFSYEPLPAPEPPPVIAPMSQSPADIVPNHRRIDRALRANREVIPNVQ